MSRVRAERAQGATFVELFFDLVFVYAITQLTSSVLHDLTWGGVGRALLVFWLVWWAWTQFTWTLNLADTENPWVRLLTLAATAIAFFLAQAVPDAFTTAGAWFAVSYAILRLIGMGVHGWVIAGDELQRSSFVTFAVASLLGIFLVVAGGFVDAGLTPWIWLAAILADLATVSVAGRGSWVLEPGHFTERHGLIVIIALGESLIAAGVATSELQRDVVFALTTTGAVLAACALWWIYFGSLHAQFEGRMAAQDDTRRGSFARDVFSLWHAAVVAGVIGVAVGFEEAVSHPHEQMSLRAALALTVGVALFVGGLAAAAWRAGLREAVASRAALAAVTLASTPVIAGVPAAAALWGLAVGTIAMVLVESTRVGKTRVLST